MFILSKFILVAIVGLLEDAQAKSISLTLNLSLALSDDHPGLSADVLRSCMKETEASMADMTRLRLGLFSNEPGDIVNGIQDASNNNYLAYNMDGESENNGNGNGINNNNNNDADTKMSDYDLVSPSNYEERNEESLQCFAHCLYERLGLMRDGIFMEPDFFRKYYTIIEMGKQHVRECLHLESNNNCEAAYKMHLCYSRLKTLDAERRIREILEQGENFNMNENYDDKDGDNDDVADADADTLDGGDNGNTEEDIDQNGDDSKLNAIERE